MARTLRSPSAYAVRLQVTHEGKGLTWGCFEQQSVLPTFTGDRFPFCHVLRDNGTLLYWNHNDSGK